MKGKKAVYYFVRRGLGTHLQFYSGWVRHARRAGVPISMVTSVSFKELRRVPAEFRRPGFVFVPAPSRLENAFMLLFFAWQFLRHGSVVVHLRKRHPATFRWLRPFFKNFRVVIEREGDLEAEADFLMEHPYKPGFYDNALRSMRKAARREKAEFDWADHVVVVTEALKQHYVKKYSLPPSKVTALTTGVDARLFRYDEELRKRARKELGLEDQFVLVYVGNVLYSWQNLGRSLEIFHKVKRLRPGAKLLVITRTQDKTILTDFLKRKKVDPHDVITLFSIPNQRVPKYLNAADLGLVVRDDHPMNHRAAPGKFGEYACCGLPILTGTGVANFSDELAATDYGIVLRDVHDDSELDERLVAFLERYDRIDRAEVATWGRRTFSFEVHVDKYVALLRRLLD